MGIKIGIIIPCMMCTKTWVHIIHNKIQVFCFLDSNVDRYAFIVILLFIFFTVFVLVLVLLVLQDDPLIFYILVWW